MNFKLSFNIVEVELKIKRFVGYKTSLIESDDFYELTKEEALQLIKPKPKEFKFRDEITEEERLQKLIAFPKTMIKFKLPDGTELIRKFKPNQTTEDLYNFIKEICIDIPFVLRKPFGKNNWVINDDTPLYKSKLVPSGVLCIVFLTKDKIQSPFIKEEVLQLYYNTINETNH
ncbi:hypothetical protein ENUP19_0162G0033 [Entamoeba nuttalli]|uniref:UBX domain containing protein n=2 Tax=Entamoeba nuttalli TaxID=412467 RepID=K2H665_ENTNP|nr:UBX domain containing protein [Entamoeba nuttalli P19]EKE41957.1 UBX domain containing protein [Entamoeba nuttalli P19]|eukprot:XP_008855712.1 UBX domain containing protein [Entamoeba nuttalli P19]